MADENKIEGEGSYTGARQYHQDQHEFAKNGPVEQKAIEDEEALDGPEGEELERARRETGERGQH